MIVGGYTLHLYCENADTDQDSMINHKFGKKGFGPNPGEFTGNYRGVAVQEARAAEEETRARNEPAFDTPAPEVEPFEGPPVEPLEDAQDINPLRGPRPSELRDDDASAVETERGQNVSNLI